MYKLVSISTHLNIIFICAIPPSTGVLISIQTSLHINFKQTKSYNIFSLVKIIFKHKLPLATIRPSIHPPTSIQPTHWHTYTHTHIDTKTQKGNDENKLVFVVTLNVDILLSFFCNRVRRFSYENMEFMLMHFSMIYKDERWVFRNWR